MKKITLFLLSAVLALTASASAKWTLQGNSYTVDTLFHANIGPGTSQTSLLVTGAYKLRVFYTTTDLTNPYVEMRSIKAGNKLAAVATVTSMAKSKDKEGARYFAGVNADFFGNSQPIGTTVVDREVYYTIDNGWNQWAIDANNVPFIGTITLSGKVTKDDVSNPITAFNVGRGENHMIIYTPKFGSNTKTNQYGTEAILTPVDKPLLVGETVKMKVTGTPSSTGSLAIPAGSYVLSGHGTSREFVAALADGDEIEVTVNFKKEDGTEFAPTQVSGGLPIILSDGKVTDTQGAIDHLTALNPRTAIGHDATKTKLVMLVVDGRSTISQGCVSRVLADIMREVGCTEALNFDGGGSSILYTRDLGTRNVPSEGTERAVTNAVFAVATSPTDNNIASIEFAMASKDLPQHSYFKPTIFGFNKYGSLVSTDLKGFTLSCDEELGTVSEDGTTLLISGTGCHNLTAKYGDLTVTVPISVTTSTNCRYKSVTTDSFNDYKVDLYANYGDQELSLNNKAFTWSSDDTSIATVNEDGIIHGVKNGKTTIHGSFEGTTYDIEVNVEIPTSRYQAIDPNLDPNSWTFSTSSMENASFNSFGDSGMAFDYTATSSRRLYFDLAKDIKLWSMPDSILFEVNTKDETLNTIYINLTNKNNEVYEYKYTVPNTTANATNKLLVPMNDIFDKTNASLYPITFNSMRILMLDQPNTTHRLEIAKFATVYSAIPADASGISEVTANETNEALILSPNPVESGESVSLNVDSPVDFVISGINGSTVAKGNGSTIETSGMKSGVYIVTIIKNSNAIAGKLVIK